jgi:hypothetical protein
LPQRGREAEGAENESSLCCLRLGVAAPCRVGTKKEQSAQWRSVPCGGKAGLWGVIEHLEGLGFVIHLAETGGGGVRGDDDVAALKVRVLAEHQPAAGAGLHAADLVFPVATFQAMQGCVGRRPLELHHLATEAGVFVDVDVAGGVVDSRRGVGQMM